MLEGAPNFRDLAGIDCGRGRVVRPGRLLRSGVLSDLTPDDLRRVAVYDVRLVCDLRSADERAQQANCWPASHSTVTSDGAVGADAVRPAVWKDMLLDPAFDGKAARERMLDGYRRMPRLYAGLLARLFDFLANAETGSALVHCMAGKDRTGFVCAMVLTALGSSREIIAADYLASRSQVALDQGMRTRLGWTGAAPLPRHAAEALSVLGSVDAAYLDASFAEIERRYGSVDAYLSEQAGLAEPLRERLRGRLLMTPEPAAPSGLDRA